ncbi:hypothetical protein EUGRSUZ_L02087 [Eucalyptus grandis]|uniref:Uncharacterized protein n=1 Tax=Eucalyptus grandis TaxID=71139 RepID=A0A058ZSW7_EUCGR|nr:hypothetical protein EUGRSUZ_L02087 [Eucalyptus grandis]
MKGETKCPAYHISQLRKVGLCQQLAYHISQLTCADELEQNQSWLYFFSLTVFIPSQSLEIFDVYPDW